MEQQLARRSLDRQVGEDDRIGRAEAVLRPRGFLEMPQIFPRFGFHRDDRREEEVVAIAA